MKTRECPPNGRRGERPKRALQQWPDTDDILYPITLRAGLDLAFSRAS